MKRLLWFVSVVFGLVLVGSASIEAQSNDLDAIIKRTQQLRATGDGYDAALGAALAQEVLASTRFGTSHLNYAFALAQVAMVHDALGRYAEASEHLKRALAIYEQTRGREHLDVATLLSSLANVYWTQGRYAEAEELYLRALAIEEKTKGRDDADVATTLNRLAHVYRRQAEDDAKEANKRAEFRRAATEHYRRALAIREKALGTNHPAVASTLGALALTLDIDKRKELRERELAIRERNAKAATQAAQALAFPLDRMFRIVSINGKDASAYLSLTLTLRERLRGEGGAQCNSWGSPALLGDDDQFESPDPIHTAKECSGTDDTNVLGEFLDVLAKVKRWRREGEIMVLEGVGQVLRLR